MVYHSKLKFLNFGREKLLVKLGIDLQRETACWSWMENSICRKKTSLFKTERAPQDLYFQ